MKSKTAFFSTFLLFSLISTFFSCSDIPISSGPILPEMKLVYGKKLRNLRKKAFLLKAELSLWGTFGWGFTK